MKNIQKKFALLLALALLTSLLGACGDGAASSAASTAETPAVSEEAAAPATEAPQPEIETDSAETVSAQEPTDEAPAVPGAHKSIADAAPDIPMELPLTTDDVTFTYFTTLNPQITGYMSDLSENLFYQTAKEMTGVNIEFQLASPDTQTENFQLMVAGGDYTDLIGSEGANYTGGVELAIQDDVYVNILDYEEYAPHYFDLVRRDEYDYASLLTDSGYMAGFGIVYTAVSYTHLTLPTTSRV